MKHHAITLPALFPSIATEPDWLNEVRKTTTQNSHTNCCHRLYDHTHTLGSFKSVGNATT